MLRTLVAVSALLALAPSAHAADFQVDTDADVAIANGTNCTDAPGATPCSIRDALAAAAGTTEGDRVLVPAGNYVLNGTSLPVTGPGSVTIVGAGQATTTIDGDDVSRVFDVSVSATIDGVTIRDGRTAGDGGGIRTQAGTLVVRNSVIESNEAGTAAGETGQGGAIAVGAADARVERSVIRDNKAGLSGGGIATGATSGPLTIVDSTVTGNHAGPATGGSANGGAIRAEQALILTRVAVTDNDATAITTIDEAAGGGAVLALDELTITDSVLSGNRAIGMNGGEARGGALYLAGSDSVQITGTTLAGNAAVGAGGAIRGGAIIHFSGALSITNSTLSGNTVTGNPGANGAAGGGAVLSAGATLTNVTIAGNRATGEMPSAGNLIAPSAALRNTLVAGGVPANCDAPVASAVGSLDTGTSCGFGAGNRNGITNPRIGPLQANGGLTPTHALLTGSPAIDAGTTTGAPATDQRGIRRPQRTGIDIGAYEFVPPPPTGGGPPPDRIAPTFAVLDLTRKRFRARRGTTVRYELSEAALVTFRIERRTSGRRVNGRCVKRRRSNRTRPRCVRYVRARQVTDQATTGANRLRLRTRRLKPGRYRLVATAVDPAGNRSARLRIPFRILARK
jgi:hypothetical protein